MSATIVWFQLDLRLDDQPALGFAVAARNAVTPMYCLDLAREGKWVPTGAGKWWLPERFSIVAGEHPGTQFQ